MRKHFGLSAICMMVSLLFFETIVFARENISGNELAPIIVTASRLPGDIENTPASVTVISRSDIESKAPAGIVDLLRQIPGLHIDQVGGMGGISSIYLRGADPNFTMVLIDGVKVNDPTNARGGSFDFSGLTVDNIDRIEIVRGPMSAIYGSDAMGGVVNIITCSGTDTPTASVEAQIGTHGYYRGHVSARASASESLFYSLGAGYVEGGTAVEGDRLESCDFNGKFDLFPNDQTHLQGVFRYADAQKERFPDDSGGPVHAVLRAAEDQDSEDITAGLNMDHELSPSLSVTLKGSWYSRRESCRSPGVAPGIRDPFGIPASEGENDFRRMHLSAGARASFPAGVRLNFGMDADFENGESEGAYDFFGVPLESRFEMDRYIYSPFMELQYVTSFNLTLHAGMRADFPEDFEEQYSPRFGMVYKIPSSNTIFKVNWGKGFKLPSFFALGNLIVGNPDLEPEVSQGFDVEVVQKFLNGRFQISATPFYNKFKNLIDLDEGPPPRLVNRTEVTSKGVELGLAVSPVDTLSIKCQATYAKTDIKDTDEQLRNRPKWRGGVDVQWKPSPDLTLGTQVVYVGENLDSSIPTGDRTLDAYTRVDVYTRWHPAAAWDLAFMIDNFFDETYEEAIGFQAPGIGARVSARFLF